MTTYPPRYADLPRGCRPVWQARLRRLGGIARDSLAAVFVLFIFWSFVTVLLLGA